MRLKDYICAEIKTYEKESFFRVVGKILLEPSFNAVYLIRKAQLSKHKILRQLYRRKLAMRYGIYLGSNTKIDIGLVIGHPSSIIIGDGVIIGKNCTLYQQTTIGQKTSIGGGYPNIGKNVKIYAGAKVIGSVKIGNNVEIGANAVVTKDCGDNCVLKGVPARCMEKKCCI